MVDRWSYVPGGTEVVAAHDYDALAADLAEIKLQRDSWKRIAESGLGLTAETPDEAAARASYLKTRACEHEWLAFTGADGLPAMNHDRCHKCGAVRGGFADDRGTVKSG